MRMDTIEADRGSSLRRPRSRHHRDRGPIPPSRRGCHDEADVTEFGGPQRPADAVNDSGAVRTTGRRRRHEPDAADRSACRATVRRADRRRRPRPDGPDDQHRGDSMQPRCDDGRMSLMDHLGRAAQPDHQVRHRHRDRRRRSGWFLYNAGAPRADASRCADLPKNPNVTAPSSCPHDPLEGFLLRIKISAYLGIALGHAGAAVAALAVHRARASTSNERRYAVGFVVSATVLFADGRGGRVLHAAAGARVPAVGRRRTTSSTSTRAQKYLMLIVYMMLAFGGGLRVPDPARVPRSWSACSTAVSSCASSAATRIVIIFVVAAVITPSGDPISLFALAIPMCIFYEISILIGRVRARRRASATPPTCMASGRASDRELASPSTGSSVEAHRGDRRRPATCWSPRPPGRARRWWPSTPWPWRSPRAARPSTRRRSRRCRTRSTATSLRRHGPERVGLLTGDNAINGDAAVVVMTTEVLRNMIYAGRGRSTASPTSCSTRSTTCRTPTAARCGRRSSSTRRATSGSCASRPRCRTPTSWPTGSATVARADRHGRRARAPRRAGQPLSWWPTRPAATSCRCATLVDGRPNPEGDRFDAARVGGREHERYQRGRARRRYGTPRRVEVVDRLATSDLLPAIYFIFSRTGCDDAAAHAARRRPAADHRRRAGPHPRHRRAPRRPPRRRRPRRARLRPLARRPRGGRRRPPRRAWCRRSRRRSRPASPRAW